MRLLVRHVAVVLCGLPLLRPQPLRAQEVQPETGLEVAWRERHGGDLVNVLKAYYTVLIHSDMTKTCRAERGEVCMNGDHEDQLWLSSTPREPERIERFVGRITEVARSRPDDALGFAQAVYAVARLRPPAEALALAEDCTLVRWWCDLVLGMVQQRAGRYERAGRHFRAALPEADSALACRLTGIGELLDDSDRRDYRRLSCSDRTDFERRFWWLTDPMISMPGNDRWTEHVTRRFELILHERLLWAIGSEHPDSHEAAVVRRGHEDSWTDLELGRLGMGRSGMESLKRWTSVRAARYRFTPVSAIGDGVAALRYDLPADGNDEGYTPPSYGPVFELPAQFARFREGGRLFVAAAAELDHVPLPFARTVFILSAGPDSIPLVLGQAERNRRPVFDALVDPATAVVGIESVARNKAVARARIGLVPLSSERFALSDPLLARPAGTDLPAVRDEAVASMLGRTTIGSGDEMVVYWEVYGTAEGQPLKVSLSIDGGPEGWFTRVLRALGVRSDARGPVVSWTEPASAPTHLMALSLDIGGLEDGAHHLRITVAGADGAEAATARHFQIDRSRSPEVPP